jgi:molybdopterin molybdotransferase
MTVPSPLLPVEAALARILAGAQVLSAETVSITNAAGRFLAEPLVARRTQPPFPASAMDGYAVRAEDTAAPPATLRLIGESVAGRGFRGTVTEGTCARIFTGAPLPDGADAIVIQENAEATDAGIRVAEAIRPGRHVRPLGLDFREGESLAAAGTQLDPRLIGLAAAMGYPTLRVARRPRVAILATGDELVHPGRPAGPDQIVVSNNYALAALVVGAGASAHDFGIARDTPEALADALAAIAKSDLDVLVTIGGASVGDHDLVQLALRNEGLELGFWRIAMRPGKPLLHGTLGRTAVLGLPGNPVSSYVCGRIFLVPLLRALQGDPSAGTDPSEPARLGVALPQNDERQDYLRATLSFPPDDLPVATPAGTQDSSMLRTLVTSDALVIRPPHAPASPAGSICRMIRLR